MDDYDTFSYNDNEDDSIYEPVLENNTPPVPPRNPNMPRVPALDYEDLTDQKSPSFREVKRYSPSNREISKMSVPDVPKRAQPRIPSSMPAEGEFPELVYEEMNDESQPPSRFPCVPVSQRAPLPLPPSALPPLPPTLPPPDDGGKLPELNYEDLEGYDKKKLPPPPSNPEITQKPFKANPPCQRKGSRGPQLAPQMDFMSASLLTSARDKLKKTSSRPVNESPKGQFSFKAEVPPKTPVRQDIPLRKEVPPKVQVSLKPPVQAKPQLPVKPIIKDSVKENTPSLPEKIASLSIDTPDWNSNKSPIISPCNTLKKNHVEEAPEIEDFCQDVYADATEVMELHYQPYYYEAFDSDLAKKIFNDKTEDGTFVVRKSRTVKEGSFHPYTLLVFYKSRSYRLRIRLEGDEYAIGEKKEGENRFCSVIELVEHYQNVPLMLIGAGQTTLKVPTEKL